MHMLVLSTDPSLVDTVTDVSKEFDIQTKHIGDHQRASDDLNRAKYAGLVLDLDTVPGAHPFIASVYESSCNKSVVVFAVATKLDQIGKALEGRAHYVLRRPVQPHAVRKTLRSAYDLLSGKQRRDFRHPANLKVVLYAIPAGAAVKGSTLNVSSNGIAVVMSTPLKIAETMRIALTLPHGFVIEANGVVVWADQDRKAGLHFQCTNQEMRIRLDAWLDTQFALLNRTAGIRLLR